MNGSRWRFQYTAPASMSTKVSVVPEDSLHTLLELPYEDSFTTAPDIDASEFIELSDHETESEIH